MNARIEVYPHDPINKCLSREVYEFRALVGISRVEIILDLYCEQQRRTTHHGWKNTKMYSRLDHRASTIQAPKLTDNMKQRAETALIESITASMRWAK